VFGKGGVTDASNMLVRFAAASKGALQHMVAEIIGGGGEGEAVGWGGFKGKGGGLVRLGRTGHVI